MEIIALTGIASTDSIELNGNSGTQQIVATGTIATKGDTGATGPTGATGEPGTNGQGVPTGGTTGQQLAKINGTDYNTQWVNPVDISGKADTTTLTAHTSNTSNPHSVTKAQVGLGSVPNTDFTSSIAAKQDTLVSTTNIKTINGVSILGSGDLTVSGGGGGGTWGSITGTLSSQTDLNSALTGKEDVSNKDTTTTLGTSDTKYPSQKAVKTYVDAEAVVRAEADKEITKANNAKLSQWFTALASAKTTPVDILVIGDSISSLGYLTFDGLPYLHKLGKKFNERMFGLPTSDQWVYAKTDGNTPQMTSNAGTANTSVGTGGWSTTMTNGQKATHTATMDGISVQYGKLPTGGSLIVRDGVGGTVLTTISTAGTTKAGNVWHSGALTLGTHTIEIEAVVGGGEVAPILEGVFVHYGTRDKGVRVWNSAHGGWTTPAFTGVPARAYDFIEVRQPDLVILATGTNDDVGNIDTRVRQLVTDVKSKTTKDILMWIPYTSTYFTPPEAEILRQIAKDEDLAVVDGEAVIGDITVAGLSADGIHPASGGTQKIADHIYSVIGADPGGNSVGPYIKPSTQTWSYGNGSVAVNQLFGYPGFSVNGTGGSLFNFMHPSVAGFFGYTGTTLTIGDGAGVVDVALSRSATATLKVIGTLVVGTAGTVTGSAVTIDGTQTLTNKTLTSPVLNTGVSGTAIDTDGTLSANSDTKLASQKATKTYADAKVSGPASSTDNAVARFDGTTGKLAQDSVVTIGDTGNITTTGTTITLNTKNIVSGSGNLTLTDFNSVQIASIRNDNGNLSTIGAVKVLEWSSNTSNPSARVTPTGASQKALVVKGLSSQTGNLQEWQDSSGTSLMSVSSAGALTTASDIEITDTTKGVILKSPDGTRWRVKIDNTGTLTTTSI